MALPSDPAERHAAVAAGFTRIADAITDWAAPSPVSGWTAGDVAGHLLDWFPAFLAAGGIAVPAGPDRTVDPASAWRHQAEAVQTLLTERGEESFTHPYAGTHRLTDAVDRFYTADVFMHSWDLARAGDLDPALDADFAATMLEGMRPIEQMLRDSGQYGPPVAVPDDAPAIDQLMGFVGRDPSWQPGTATG